MTLQLRHFALRFAAYVRRHWVSGLFQLLLVALVLGGVQLWQTRHVLSGPAPDWSIQVVDPTGQVSHTTLAEWRTRHPNQAVAIHFWAHWCPICRAEENSITRLSRDWPVLTVAMQSGPPRQVAATMRTRELPWQVVMDERGVISEAHGIHAVPSFVVVDSQGRLRTPTVGYTTEIGMRLRLWWVQWSH
jgi:thiol-disulfide isomerase/thioredoxin